MITDNLDAVEGLAEAPALTDQRSCRTTSRLLLIMAFSLVSALFFFHIPLRAEAAAPPTGGKTFSPSPAVAGGSVAMTITLTNPNPGEAIPLTTFTDDLPDDGAGHAMVVAPGLISAGCTGIGAVSGILSGGAPGSHSITLTNATIGQGGACTIHINVVVPVISGTSQTFDNSLAEGAIGNTLGLTSPAFNQTLTVNGPNLYDPQNVTKSVDGSGFPVLHYTAVIINSGIAPATDAVFTDQIPLHTTYVPGSITMNGNPVSDAYPDADGGYDSANTRLVIDMGTILPATSVTITFDVMVEAFFGGSISNQASVSGSNFETEMTDDPATPPQNDPTTFDAPSSIPTLNEWGMIIFLLLAGLISFYFLRKRKRDITG